MASDGREAPVGGDWAAICATTRLAVAVLLDQLPHDRAGHVQAEPPEVRAQLRVIHVARPALRSVGGRARDQSDRASWQCSRGYGVHARRKAVVGSSKRKWRIRERSCAHFRAPCWAR